MTNEEAALLEEYKKLLEGQRLYEEEQERYGNEVTVIEDDILGTIITTSTRIPNPPSAKELRKMYGLEEDDYYDNPQFKRRATKS